MLNLGNVYILTFCTQKLTYLNKSWIQAAQGFLGCIAWGTEFCLRVRICQFFLAVWNCWLGVGEATGKQGWVSLASFSPHHCCKISWCSSRRVKVEVGTGQYHQQHHSIFAAYCTAGKLLNTSEQPGKMVSEEHFSAVVLTLPPLGSSNLWL